MGAQGINNEEYCKRLLTLRQNPPVRETSGIKRLAIMHDDGVNAFGFKQPDILLEWMIANGFPVRDVNLALYG